MQQFQLHLLATVMSFALVGSAVAAASNSASAAGNAEKPSRAIKPTEMTCEEFLAVDDVSKPAIIYWAEGFNSKGKPGERVVDIEQTNRLVPVVIQDCQKEPKASFWSKTEREIKKIF